MTQGARRGSDDRHFRQQPRRESPASGEAIRAEALTERIVTELYGVMLELDGLRGLVGQGPAEDRVARCTSHIEDLLAEIRTVLADDMAPTDHE